MRRAGRGDVEVGGKFRHFPHQAYQAAVAAAKGLRLALILDRAAHFVAAGEAVDVGAMLGKPSQQNSEILELGRPQRG